MLFRLGYNIIEAWNLLDSQRANLLMLVMLLMKIGCHCDADWIFSHEIELAKTYMDRIEPHKMARKGFNMN